MKTLEHIWEVELSLDGKEVFERLLVSTDEQSPDDRGINAAITKAEQHFKEAYTDADFQDARAISVKLTGHTIVL
jgi:hypothetical protein